MDDQISLAASTRTSAAGGDHYSERAWSKLNYYSTNILAPQPLPWKQDILAHTRGLRHSAQKHGFLRLTEPDVDLHKEKAKRQKTKGMTKNEKRTKEKENKEKTKHSETCTNLELLKLVTQMSRMRSEIPLNPVLYSVLRTQFHIQYSMP